MSRSNFYLSSGTRAYLIKDDGSPVHIELLSIEAIRLSRKQALLKQLLLHGITNLLMNFPESAQIDITYQEYGVFKYDKGQVIIRLTNCKLRRNWIPNPVIQVPDDQEALSVYALICCDIEVLNENH